MRPHGQTRSHPHQGGHGRPEHERDPRRDHPTPERVAEALEKIADHEIPGTPPLWALRTIREAACGERVNVGRRSLKEFRIAGGRPDHGALRSDPHVSRYVIHFPRRCPECDHHEAKYRYSAHHHISGSWSVWCTACESKLDGEEWG